MKSIRARAILRSYGYIKRSDGSYRKREECRWCTEGTAPPVPWGEEEPCWLCEGDCTVTDTVTLDHFKEIIEGSGYHEQVTPCEGCGTDIPVDGLQRCCDGYLCGCGGMSIDPILCRKCSGEALR
ncbi:hypothetical protein [Bacillus phage BM-P1]|nr:hypothetical protein [Bacillus phage BM-P1]